MCFRIEQEEEDDGALLNALRRAFGEVVAAELVGGTNIALTNDANVLYMQEGLRLAPMRFGLVPSWVKEATTQLGNARSETAAEKPSYRAAFKKRRCLIPVSGFYEWRLDPGEKQKTPYRVTVLGQDFFYLAGLWEYWQPQELLSFTILTTTPNPFIAQLHDRMPVILPSKFHDMWLDPENDDREGLQAILQAYPAEEMGYQAYDRYVSKAGNRDRSKIVPAGELVTVDSGDPLVAKQESLF